MLTQKTLKDNLTYNYLTGEFKWLISPCGKVKIGSTAGYILTSGYGRIMLQGGNYAIHRLVWLYTYGEFPSGVIDHIDGNPSNNKLENLRECSRQQNQKNMRKARNNTSGYKGVSWNIKAKKWLAKAKLAGKNYYLGVFEKVEDAAKAYADFTKKHHGEFYRDTVVVA